MKKLLVVLLSVLCVISLAACSNGGGETTKESKPQVGVLQLVEHPALDAATQGFIDAVTEAFGDEYEVVVKNAGGQGENCITIANGFVDDGVKLIMANATPAVQAASTATAEIPVVGTAVTEYGTALGIDNFSGTVGNNVTGASDLAPLVEQAAMVPEIFPEAKTVSIIYCLTEANSLYQVKAMTEAFEALGLEVKSFGFNDTNDVTQVTQDAAAWGDVMYIPTDNTAAANTEAIANVVLSDDYLTPVVAGEEGIAAGCGVVTLTISYYDLGVKTGKIAVEILKGGDPATMPIQYADNFTKKFNATNAEKFGLTDTLTAAGYIAIEG